MDQVPLRLETPDAKELKQVQELFREGYCADRSFEWREWLEADSDLAMACAREEGGRLLACLVLNLEERPPTLPAEAPSRFLYRGMAVADGRHSGTWPKSLLLGTEDLLSRQGRKGRLLLIARTRWLRRAVEQAGLKAQGRIQYLKQPLRADEPAPCPPGVRGYRAADLPLVAAGDAATFPADWHMAEREVRRQLQRGDQMLVAGEEHPLGYVLIGAKPGREPFFPPYGFVHRLAVWPTHQSQGLGSQLLEAAMRWMRARDLTTIRLNALPADEKAWRFYLDRGFVPERLSYPVFLLPVNARA